MQNSAPRRQSPKPFLHQNSAKHPQYLAKLTPEFEGGDRSERNPHDFYGYGRPFNSAMVQNRKGSFEYTPENLPPAYHQPDIQYNQQLYLQQLQMQHIQLQQQRLIQSSMAVQEEPGNSPPSIFAHNIYNDQPGNSEYSNQYPDMARQNPRFQHSMYNNSNLFKSSTTGTVAGTSGSTGEKNLVNQFRKKSLGPKAIHNNFNVTQVENQEGLNDVIKMQKIQQIKQIHKNTSRTATTPKLIVHGIRDCAQMTEIHNLGQQFEIKNFDIASMRKDGIIKLIFVHQHEALQFKTMLEETNGYRVELMLVRDQLQEIPEETLYRRGTQYDEFEYAASLQLDGSEGHNSSQNKYSPVSPNGRYFNNQIRNGIQFTSSMSNISSGGENNHNNLGQLNIISSEIRTQVPQQHGFEKISYASSGMGGQINNPKFLLGTIGSHGGGSDDCTKYVKNPLGKNNSKQSFASSQGQNDGGPVDVIKILNGEENRTNLMVKNVPCRYSQAEIRDDFEKNHKNRFNDLKVPMDKLSFEKTGKGYCFMNFRHVLFVYDFFHDKKGYHWPKFASDKQIDINFAKEQPILPPQETLLNQMKGTSDYKITDSEIAELQKILDDNGITIPLEKFPPIQPPGIKPKYCNKVAQKMTNSFISNTNDEPVLNQSRHSYTNMHYQIQQQQIAQATQINHNRNKNKHYSTSQALHGQTTYPILTENQNIYRNNILRNKLAIQAQIIDEKNEAEQINLVNQRLNNVEDMQQQYQQLQFNNQY